MKSVLVTRDELRKLNSQKVFLGIAVGWSGIVANVSICVRAGLPKPRPVPDTKRNKDTKTLDYASTPLDANTV
ncbi:MAG: hypothetical protein ACK47E_18360, partial [Cyclobacteriaceae bacterium]